MRLALAAGLRLLLPILITLLILLLPALTLFVGALLVARFHPSTQ